MRVIFIVLIIASSLTLAAQQSVPLFSNKQDSVAYAQIQAELQKTLSSPQDPTKARKIDSLFKLQSAFRDKIIGFKTIYKPDKDYTPLSELMEGKVSPESVTKLSISNTPVKKIPRIVRQCSNLEELEWVNTTIKKIPKNVNKLEKLKGVYIYNNTTKKPLALKKNTHVTQLLLRGMNQHALPVDYSSFAALEELNLSQNIGLTKFPNIYQNAKLKKVNLIDNQITLEDLKSAKGSTLEELILQRNKIKTVPATIGSFTELKKVSFNYNAITEVQGVERLQKLEEVSFYQNKLQQIPAGIYALTQLKSIDLYHNEINKIDDKITDLQSLEILYLSNNQLATLPENIGGLTHLRELYLSNNKLFVLPASLAQLKNLTTLRVNQNKLTDFPEFILNIPSIENIDISSNNISVIPEKITGLPNLNIFVFGDNPVNKEEVNLLKIIETLQRQGTIVHQNLITKITEQ